jgi:hypothetical protein
MFSVAVESVVDNGQSVLFWFDRLLKGRTISELAPNLFKLISKKTHQQTFFSSGLDNHRWTADIKGALTVQVLGEYLYIWEFGR